MRSLPVEHIHFHWGEEHWLQEYPTALARQMATIWLTQFGMQSGGVQETFKRRPVRLQSGGRDRTALNS